MEVHIGVSPPERTRDSARGHLSTYHHSPSCQPLHPLLRDSASFELVIRPCNLVIFPKKCRQKPLTPGRDSGEKTQKDPRIRGSGLHKRVILVDRNESSATMRNRCAALAWDWGCRVFTAKMTNPRNDELVPGARKMYTDNVSQV